jgi:PPE-repeat protein
MPSPSLSSYQDKVTDTVGNALPGATIAVLTGQLDTVNATPQPGTPLAHIFADPYGNSEIPQAPIALSGTVSTVAGSPIVTWVSGSLLSQFLPGHIITINGVQYTVGQWINANTVVLITPQNALSTGTFAYSATIPVTPLESDSLGNVEFWAAGGWYVLQIYDSQMPTQLLLGISIAHV